MPFGSLIAVALLVLANAFFVAAEFGLVAVRSTRVDELVAQGSRRAASARKAIRELNLMLSGCQLGITFSSLGLGWVGEPALARMLRDAFDFLSSPFDLIAAHGTAVVIAFAIITALHVVLGELVPKNLAIAAPESTALWIATPMRAFALVFRPVIWLFNESANVILRSFGVEPRPEIRVVHSPDELAIIVEESRRGGAIEAGQSEILTRTLEFREKRAVDAMVARTSVESVSADAGLDDVLEVAERTGYSRFPVWRERQDEFIGIAHLKDIIRQTRTNEEAVVGDVARAPLVVMESLPLENVLVLMKRGRTHIAVVVDEFGSTSGIVTMEDILEELVGEISDEYDVKTLDIRKIEGGVRVSGSIRPDELEDHTGCKLPEGDFETVAGFILERLGRMARRGDEVLADGWKLRVANVRRRRIVSVDVQPPPRVVGTEESGERSGEQSVETGPA